MADECPRPTYDPCLKDISTEKIYEQLREMKEDIEQLQNRNGIDTRHPRPEFTKERLDVVFNKLRDSLRSAENAYAHHKDHAYYTEKLAYGGAIYLLEKLLGPAPWNRKDC